MVAVEGQHFWSLDFWPPRVRPRPRVRPCPGVSPLPAFSSRLESAPALESAPSCVKFVGRRPTKPGDYKGAEPPYRVNVSPEG